MFYSAPESTVCDICEGPECAEKCAPKAQAQQSSNGEVNKSGAIFKEPSEPSVASSNIDPLSTTLALATTAATVLSNMM